MRCFLTSFLALVPLTFAAGSDQDFFEKKIRPILIEHCYDCHSHEAGKSKGGLFLDSRQGWQKGGDSGPAIVPGDPENSLVIQAVGRSGIVSEMPPKERLPNTVVADLKNWISRGAFDPREGTASKAGKPEIDLEKGRQFWSFQPPYFSQDKEKIDQFINPKSVSAPPEKLLRRLFYDLNGLPPGKIEREKFLREYSASPQKAVAALVDDLLARPAFGEKWGRHWLDLARYADSNGGDINLTYKEAWRYRNYVIDAFNHDMPYDQFIREQLAGDLLPFSSPEERNRQLVATGFLMVGPKMLSERNKAKMHLDIVDEQLDTVGRTFLGLTLGCARCHDHKFDPVPTRDYYAMAGIFHSSATAYGIRMNNVNVSGWHETDLEISPEEKIHLAAFKKNESRLTKEINRQKESVKKLKEKSGFEDLQGIVVDDVAATVVGQWRKSTFRPNFIGTSYLATDKINQENTYIVWPAKLPKPGVYEVRLGCGSGNGIEESVPVMVEHDGGKTRMTINQQKPGKIDSFWHVLGKFTFSKGSGQVTLFARGTDDYVLADAVQFIHEDDLKSKKVASPQSPFTQATSRLQSLEKELKAAKAKAPRQLRAMAIGERKGKEFGDLAIRIRGEAKNKGELVPRGFLEVVSFSPGKSLDIPEDQSGRKELAEWLSHPNHPLTARVMTNRIWQHLFGEGLVRSSDNFGTLGDTPSHPELLDWLANQLVRNNWSIKHLIRLIVLSDTYQQEAKLSPESDPDNRAWQHQNRRPLSAEAIRDSMLAISGLLNREKIESAVGNLGDQAIANSASQGGANSAIDQNRNRSVYLPMIRNAMPKVLEIFDMANPDMVTGKRPQTTVPAQALYLMNSPFVQEMALVTSRRILENHDDIESALEDVYIDCLSRKPTTGEISNAKEYIDILEKEEQATREESPRFLCPGTLFLN